MNINDHWLVQHRWLVGSGLFILTLLPRIIPPAGIFVNVDTATRWIVRVKGFIMTFSGSGLEHMIQAPHPGVTLLWLMTPAEWFLRTFHAYQWFDNPIVGYVEILKIPYILVLSGLITLIYPVLSGIIGRPRALAVAVLMALEPLLIVFSRYLHLDGLLAVFFLLSLAAYWQAACEPGYRWAIWSGVFTALGLLTRINIGPPLLAGFVIAGLIHGKRWRKLWRSALVGLGVFFLTIALVWPGAVVHPRLARGVILRGVTLGLTPHEVPSNADTDPIVRSLLYPLFIVTRTYSLVIIFALIGAVACWRRRGREPGLSFVRYLIVVSLLFWLFLLWADKKIDRYALPLIGPVAIMAIYGWTTINRRLTGIGKKLWLWGLAGAMLLQMIIFLRLAPYYQTYLSSLGRWLQRTPLKTSAAYSPMWGEGLYQAVEYLESKPAWPIAASWYPSVFCFYGNDDRPNGYPFTPTPGRSCARPLLKLDDSAKAEYVIIGRSQVQQQVHPRLLDDIKRLAWQPEKVISFNGVPYVWIYHNNGGLSGIYRPQE